VQSQRETELTRSFNSDEPEASLTLSYIEPPDLEASRKALFQWNRETRSIRNVEFMRSLEDALQSGALQNFPGLAAAAANSSSSAGSSGGQQSSAKHRRQNDRANKTSSSRPGGRNPASKRSGGRAPSGLSGHNAARPNDPYSMDKKKWGSKYGAAHTLCWWHANSPKGCQRSPCSLKHQYPTKYAGSPFAALASSDKTAICAACAK
jgi:hypothetical protein